MVFYIPLGVLYPKQANISQLGDRSQPVYHNPNGV